MSGKVEWISLNGEWKMKEVNENAWKDAIVPGSVFSDMLRRGEIEDPYYRFNMLDACEMTKKDYEYLKTFDVEESVLGRDTVLLIFEGLDTLAEIYLNGREIARTNNMHRIYKFDVKDRLYAGENELRIVFRSPMLFALKMVEDNDSFGAGIKSTPGFEYIRKGACMFGWNSEPQIPDSGIWRDVHLCAFDDVRIKDVFVKQKHQKGPVTVTSLVDLEKNNAEMLHLELAITAPNGAKQSCVKDTKEAATELSIDIDAPQLWWPNTYGEQPLYDVSLKVFAGEQLIDEHNLQIGLRDLYVRREKDELGESFEFICNGQPIFAKGGDFIPNDKFIPMGRGSKLEKMILDCVAANYNCIRVWGGGIYPDDEFFDLCDKYGILVWQDLAFACSTVYQETPEFIENVTREIEDNVIRLRNHPSLALWCGNNEIEWVSQQMHESHGLFTEYSIPIEICEKNHRLFEQVWGKVVEKLDPTRLYWPSSPSSGGQGDPNCATEGDCHNWEVWHQAAAYTTYENHMTRFLSEFGFQSLPDIKTLKQYLDKEDLKLTSRGLEFHQRADDSFGNAKLAYFIMQDLPYPKDFESFIKASQIVQGEAIAFSVNHLKRNLDKCYGALYWQIDDCWPAISWSSLDYTGRWKAAHYFAKRVYAPVTASAKACGEKEARIYVVNELQNEFAATLYYEIRENGKAILSKEKQDITVKGHSTLEVKVTLPSEFNEEKEYIAFGILQDGQTVYEDTLLLVKPKHFDLQDPELKAEVIDKGDAFEIQISSEAYAHRAYIDLSKADFIASDNYFNLSAGNTKSIFIDKASLSEKLTLAQLKEQLSVKSIYNIEN